MGFNVKEDDAIKQQKILKSSYEMYERTKNETRRNMKDAVNKDGTKKYSQKDIDDRINMIQSAEDEIIEKFKYYGGNPDDLKISSQTRREKVKVEPFYFNDDDDDDSTTAPIPIQTKSEPIQLADNDDDDDVSSLDLAANNTSETMSQGRETATVIEQKSQDDISSFIPSRGEMINNTQFDVVPLPSKGECYKNKISKIAVSYLNAYDENIITAPNLYRENAVIDTILRRKIQNDTIASDDLLEGDRDAIILFLRATGFGTEYPITATDNVTGKEFETTIDLSKLNFKNFNLIGDSNGWFDYKLPMSGDEIKFKFLTHGDMKVIERADELENNQIRKRRIEELSDTIDTMVDMDKSLTSNDRLELRNVVKTLHKWADNISEEYSDLYTHTFTNTLELSVMSVNGNTDRKYIRKYVRTMNIKDASSLRRYIEENEPGIDYNITIEKPQSLGGGSMKVFLQIDQYLFLNVP